MPNLTSVTITNGVPTAGSGTVSTIDNIPALWDKGAGTGGTATQRVIIDTASQNANGQATMANSSPVVIASDQSNIPTNLKQVNGAAFALGQTTMSASLPVAIASDQGALPVTSSGNVASGSADSGNPVKQGFKATTSLSGLTLVSDANRSDARSGVDGVQLVRTHTNLEDIVTGRNTDTAGSSTSCIAAQAAGIKTYLTSVALTNSSASNITVNLLDGVTVKWTLPVPANSGCVWNPPVPLPGSAATAWNFQGSAAATTLTCSMIGFKSKI